MNTEEQQQLNKGYEYAMFLLNIKLRTEGELNGKMKGKKYNEATIANVINQLKENRYVDDKRFAEVYLENLKKYKSWGFYGIKKKLIEKRLPKEIIESVLSEGLSEEEELEIAKKFLKKQSQLSESSKTKTLNHQGFRAQTARKLAAKGFRGSVVGKI